MVKVGKTSNFKSRLTTHAKDAKVHGHSVLRTWESPLHSNHSESEAALISYCSGRWQALAREFFQGADFDEVVVFAEDLTFEAATASRERDLERERRSFLLSLESLASPEHRHAAMDAVLAEGKS